MPGNNSRTASRTATPAGGASPMLSRPRGVRDTLSCECRRPRTPSPAMLSPPQTPPRRHRSRSPLAPPSRLAPPSPSPSARSSDGDDLQPVGCGSPSCQAVLSTLSSSASLGNLSRRAAAGPASYGRDSDVEQALTLRSPQPVRAAAARSDAPIVARRNSTSTRAAVGWGLGVPPRDGAGRTLPSLPSRNTTAAVAAAAEGGATAATGADDDPKWRAMLPAPLFKDRGSSATSIPAIPPPLPPVARRRPGTGGVRPRPLSYPAAVPSRSSNGTNPAAAPLAPSSSSSSSSPPLLPPFLPAGASSRPSSRPPPSPSRHSPSPSRHSPSPSRHLSSPTMTRGPTRHSPAPRTAPLSPLSQPHSKRGTADVATDVTEGPRPPAPREIAMNVHAAMYSVQPDAQAAAARDYLDENATFADPIVIAATSDSVKTAFVGLKLAFALVEPKITSVTEGTDDAGNHVVAVDADIAYTLRLLPIKLTVRTLSKFVIDSGSNRVVFHEDIWSVADLMEQIPIVGTLYSSLARPFASSMTSMLVAMLMPKQVVPPSTSSTNGSTSV